MKCKFAVHVAGPDDLIPVHDIDEAVRVSAFMNAEYAAVLKNLEGQHPDGFTPHCFAAPTVWPHSDEAHEQELQRLKQRAKEEGMQLYWLTD